MTSFGLGSCLRIALARTCRCQLRRNILTNLAELDAHLVVRVDAPDRTLDVDLVLVHGDEGTERTRRELLEHDRVGRTVALKDLRLDKGAVLRSLRAKLLNDLLLSLAESKSPDRISGSRALKTYSGWAKKLESRISWCLPPAMGFRVSTGAMKSLVISCQSNDSSRTTG